MSARQAIVAAMRRAAYPDGSVCLSLRELGAAAGVSHQRVGQLLPGLIAAGAVELVKAGRRGNPDVNRGVYRVAGGGHG